MMKTAGLRVFRVFLLITLFAVYIYCLSGQVRGREASISRNAAWNDLVKQLDPSTDNAPGETLEKELVVIQRFLKEHQSEANVEIYDLTVFRAIEQARARFQKADKDLETIRNGLSEKEYQAKADR